VYEDEAKELVKRLMKSVLVRDLNPIDEGLEVPRYHHCYTYYVSQVFFRSYGDFSSIGMHMLYTKEEEDDSVAVIIRHIIPEKFPKTWEYIFSKTKKKMEENDRRGKDITTNYVEAEIIKRVNTHLFSISRYELIEKIGPGIYRIPADVRQNRLIPDCLPEYKQQEILRKFQARQLNV
jgi:hypothetical protein